MVLSETSLARDEPSTWTMAISRVAILDVEKEKDMLFAGFVLRSLGSAQRVLVSSRPHKLQSRSHKLQSRQHGDALSTKSATSGDRCESPLWRGVQCFRSIHAAGKRRAPDALLIWGGRFMRHAKARRQVVGQHDEPEAVRRMRYTPSGCPAKGHSRISWCAWCGCLQRTACGTARTMFFFEWAGFIRRTGHRDHYRAIALLGATDGYPLVSGAVTPLKRPLPMSAEAQFVTDGVRTCVLGFREPRFYHRSMLRFYL